MGLGRIFLTGMMISFLGTLPLGTLNVSAMQLSLTDGLRPAYYFAIGALMVEMIYVRMSLVAMNWVRQHKKLLITFEWITLFIMLALAASSFYAASQPSVQKNPILSNTIHRFWLGCIMSAVNPLQIPFWFGWSTILYDRGVLQSRSDHFNTYIFGIGLGTLLGSSVFIFGGQLLFQYMAHNQTIVHTIIGVVFAATAIIQAIKMWRHQDAVSKMK